MSGRIFVVIFSFQLGGIDYLLCVGGFLEIILVNFYGKFVIQVLLLQVDILLGFRGVE